jgi:predicted ATPase/DNA-binding winged helix-turn-helix (wHTH) protein
MDMEQPAEAFVFGRFCLIPNRRALLADGRDVALSDRPFEILLALLMRRDRVVLKDEILQSVWAGRVVEEGNLTVHIAHLRKLLGSGIIATASGKGYRFVAPVEQLNSPPIPGATHHNANSDQPRPERLPTNLPVPASPLIGREAAIATVTTLLETHRIVTLTGAGGIGKTRLAIEVARQTLSHYGDGAWLVELGPLSGEELVPSTVASALRLDIAGHAEPIGGITRALRSKRMLLILDNCEHVIGSAARIAEAVIRASPGLRALVTSREPLRAEGEFQYRVPSLAVPAHAVQRDMQRYSAIQLFAARAAASRQDFPADEDALRLVATICRRLDGIPLAIELAAARAAALGLRELASRLDDRFAVLTGGRRTALPRHQTLRATLDWSYGLLTETDRAVFLRLAIFAGDFSVDGALHVAVEEEITQADALDALANLVEKSLVVTENEGAATRYRLLETTRAYALEKLNSDEKRDATARRHAEYLRDLFERAAIEWQTNSTADWLAVYARRLDDVHVALDWTSSAGQDATIGAALAVGAMPLWLELSLIEEGLRRTQRAIATLEASPDQTKRQLMMLYAALARLQLHSVTSFRICGIAWAGSFRLADELGDIDYQLHVLWGAYAGAMTGGQFREALDIAHRFREVANASGRAEQLIGHRMIGSTLSRLGDQLTARMHTELMLSHYESPRGRRHSIMFGGDQRAMARGTEARILWLQGFPEQAMREVEESCGLIDQDLSVLTHRLVTLACPILLCTGDLAKAERYSNMLQEFTAEHACDMRDHADCLAAELFLAQGDGAGARTLIEAAVGALRQRGAVQHLTWQLSVMARVRARTGQTAEALVALEEALSRCKHFGEGWCRPELFRIKAEVLLQRTDDSAPAAERLLAAALALARRQGARSWELRIATSLARLRLKVDRKREGLDLLKPVYEGFTEGFATVDLQQASSLLQELA